MKPILIILLLGAVGIILFLFARKNRSPQADAESAVARGEYQFIALLDPDGKWTYPQVSGIPDWYFQTTGIRPQPTKPETSAADLAYMKSYNEALTQALKTQGKFHLIEENVARLAPTDQISYSQLDITERFDDNQRLKPDDWISTMPLNKSRGGNVSGLPPVDATDDQIYEAALRLSKMRESFSIPNDGVYCPVCHIANTQLSRLRTPCPKCGRALLKFGWD